MPRLCEAQISCSNTAQSTARDDDALFGVQIGQIIYQMQLKWSKNVRWDRYYYAGLHYGDILV